MTDKTGTQPSPPTQFDVNKAKGAQAHDNLQSTLEAKGNQLTRETVSKGGQGGSRHDLSPVPGSSQTTAFNFESKYMNLAKYRTDTGLLDKQKILEAVMEDMGQVAKHEAALRSQSKMGDLPYRERLVYSLENASLQDMTEFRSISRLLGRIYDIKVGVMRFEPKSSIGRAAGVGLYSRHLIGFYSAIRIVRAFCLWSVFCRKGRRDKDFLNLQRTRHWNGYSSG